MSNKRPLAEFFSVLGRFHRSTHLRRDWQDQRGLADYVLSPHALETVNLILGAIEHEQRSWSLVGPYGTGKSSFTLFLADALCTKKPKHPQAAKLRKKHSLSKVFEPVILVGQHAPIHLALAEKLRQYVRGVRDSATHPRTDPPDTRTVLQLLENSIKKAKKQKKSGILLLIDEFGKYLEFAAQNPDTNDLILLQEIAELSDRSDPPVVFVNVLHTGFAQYMRAGNSVQIAEWQKVAGRLREISFRESGSHMLRLLGNAIEPKPAAKPYERVIRYQLNRKKTKEILAEPLARLHSPNLLSAAVPIHPIAAVVLPHIFMSKLAQNERSLFSFLTSVERNGFTDFLNGTPFSGKKPTFYRLHQLYDYVSAAFGTAMFLGDQSQQWVEIDHALHRISQIRETAPVCAGEVVKTIALLGMYGKAPGILPSKATIGYAVGDVNAVSKALEYLEKKGIIAYRKHQGAYHLWEGSDVDLDKCYQDALAHVGHGGLHKRLSGVLDDAGLHPLVARRHFIDSGTLRYFECSVVEGNRAAMETAFSQACDSSSGQLICVLPQTQSGLKELVDVAKELTAEGGDPGPGKRTLFFFPKPIVGLENALREYEAWRWVSALPVLRGDRVARKETQARLMQAQDDLKIRLSGVFSIRGHPFNPSLSQWVHKGTVIDQVQVENNKLLQRYLSEELNDIYRNSPRLRNELIDRRELSSQGGAARNKLLNAMIASEGQERLGLTGAPAEATMYDALLGSSGIHAKYKSRLCFGIPRRLTKKTAPPDDLEQRERWVQVWKRIRKFMDKQATKAPRPVEELYDVLRQPPYGLLDGPLPVLLAAYYLSKKENAALFYEGLFVARPTPETFHLLARRPDLFSIQTHKTKRAEQHLLGQVHDLLKDIDLTLSATSEPKLIETVKALVMFEHSLPPYTKATRQIRPAEAREVARALRTAQAPKELIFQTIPKILGCSPDANREKFVPRLSDCLQALAGAYGGLLDRIGQRTYGAFRLPANDVTPELPPTALSTRAQAIQHHHPKDPILRRFIQAAATLADEPHDWRERLATAIVSTPPKHWNDQHENEFHTQMYLTSSDFVRLESLEEIAVKQGATDDSTIIGIGIQGDRLGEEKRDIVVIGRDEEEQLQELVEKLNQSVSDNGLKDNRLRLAALARLAQTYMKTTED